MEKTKTAAAFLDTNETYWSLGCILGFLGIPNIVIGNQIAQAYGVTWAIISIIIGNLVLWVLGLGIASMAQGRSHAIDNIKKQFGKTSSFLAILLFTLAFLMWYTLQLSSAASKIFEAFQFSEEWKVGLVLGGIVAILSSGGFKMVKWACLIGLPISVMITLYFIASGKGPVQHVGTSYFSLLTILPVVMTWLAGTVNFPTFFRHARSKTHITISLALILLFHTFFQVSTIFYGLDVLSINIVDAKQNHMILSFILSTFFSVILFVCMNLINVYFVSACWERLFPRDSGNKKYIICASIGTLAYVYLEITNNLGAISLAENAITYSMVILVLALLINFIISISVKHRIRSLSHFVSSASWIIGCVVTIRSLMQNPEQANQSLISGVIATVLFSILAVFVEETAWSAKTVLGKNKSP